MILGMILLAAAAAGGAILAFTNTVYIDSDVSVAPANATAGIRFDTDGGIYGSSDGTQLGSWVIPNSAAPAFTLHVRLTGTLTGSASLGGGLALNTWYALTVDREWFYTQSSNGTSSFSGTIEMSTDGGSTVADSASVTLDVERTT